MKYYIGDFSRLTGLSIHTLRFYEQEGLIHPARDAGGRRIYTEQDLAWTEFVQRLKETGMPLREIRRYAELRAGGMSTMPERLEMLEAHREVLAAQICSLQEHQEKLGQKIDWYMEQIAQLPAQDPLHKEGP